MERKYGMVCGNLNTNVQNSLLYHQFIVQVALKSRGRSVNTLAEGILVALGYKKVI